MTTNLMNVCSLTSSLYEIEQITEESSYLDRRAANEQAAIITSFDDGFRLCQASRTEREQRVFSELYDECQAGLPKRVYSDREIWRKTDGCRIYANRAICTARVAKANRLTKSNRFRCYV